MNRRLEEDLAAEEIHSWVMECEYWDSVDPEFFNQFEKEFLKKVLKEWLSKRWLGERDLKQLKRMFEKTNGKD